jgi:hypothetical protein
MTVLERLFGLLIILVRNLFRENLTQQYNWNTTGYTMVYRKVLLFFLCLCCVSESITDIIAHYRRLAGNA